MKTALAKTNIRGDQSHFRTYRLASPFQPRIEALAKTEEWYSWAGYKLSLIHI